MRHIVNIDNWERKDNFKFFKTFINPCISITSEVECGQSKEFAKEKGQSFFLYYLHAILKAVNNIKELRYRIEFGNELVWYDEVDVLVPVKMNEKGKFYTVRIPHYDDFEHFYREASKIIENIPKDGDPYAAENLGDGKSGFNVVLVSATPDLYFTSITHTQENENGGSYPLLNVGKAVRREGKTIIPIAIAVHHGFVDGFHISDFFRQVEAYLLTIKL